MTILPEGLDRRTGWRTAVDPASSIDIRFYQTPYIEIAFAAYASLVCSGQESIGWQVMAHFAVTA